MFAISCSIYSMYLINNYLKLRSVASCEESIVLMFAVVLLAVTRWPASCTLRSAPRGASSPAVPAVIAPYRSVITPASYYEKASF